MMRTGLLLLALAIGLQGCAAKHESSKVQALSLRDERLPIDARRWLADAEDEVAIAEARLDDAQRRLADHRQYGDELVERAEQMTAGQKSEASSALQELFGALSKARVAQMKLELKAARRGLDHARARLVLHRAETAMRHDVAVYELEPLEQSLETSRERVAEAERDVEVQRAAVDAAAAAVWTAYADFVEGGGSTEALWQSSRRRN